MAFASRTYTPGSSTTDFALTNTDGNAIGYIRESDITVKVNGTTFTNAASGANTYQFTGAVSLEQPSGTTIRLNAGVTGTVALSRATGISSATVTYTAGSTLTSSDLNNADNQIRFGLQEFNDTYDAFLTGTGDFSTLAGVIGGSETWTSSDAFMATTGAINTRIGSVIDTALTTDVSGGDGVTIVDNSPGAGQIRIDLDADIATLRNMQTGAATALAALTATEVGILDGATATTAEFNFIDGVTSGIQAQLNTKQTQDADLDQLSGCQAGAAAALAALTQAEVQILDGATVSTAELNLLDGVPGTLTTAEIGHLDGVTSAIQTQLNAKQTSDPDLTAIAALSSADGNFIVGSASGWVAESGATARTSLGAQTLAADLTNLSSMQTGASAALRLLTSTEIEILDGATPSTTELNFVDGVTSAIQGQLDLKQPLDTELTTLAGMTGGTASILANATGLGATLAEINSICENRTAETTISPTDDTKIPTSKAVNDRILTVTNALGGFVAIDNEGSFPNTHPDPGSGAGTVVSIADVGGLVVNSSGVATNASTLGGTAVTINGIATTFRDTTMTAGVGMQVQTTSTLNTYDYHKAILREQDISSISTDIEDFGNRYRVGSSNPTSDNDAGDLFFNTGTDKMLVRNAANSSWDEVQSIGNFFINTISSAGSAGDTPPGGSATFNGTAQKFTLSNAGSVAEQHIVSINGVVQKPNAGTSVPSEGFSMNGAVITFAAAPPASAPFYIITIGAAVNIGTPSDNTVDPDILQSGCVSNAKVATNAAIAGSKIAPDFGSQNIVTTGTLACGDITSSDGNGNLTLKDNNHTANNTEHKIAFTASDNTELINLISPFGEQHLRLRHGANELVLFKTDGEVCIGTTTGTGNNLTVQDAGTSTTAGGNIVARFQTNGAGRDATIQLSDNDSHSATISMLSSDLIFQNAGTERLRIHSGGQTTVGTPTSNASDKFTILDSGSAFMSIRSDSHADANSQVLDFGVGTSNRASGNLTASIEADIHSTSGGTLKGELLFFTNSGDSLTEKLRIKDNGRVGIGTTGPEGLLHIFGASAGSITPDSNADDLLIENSTSAGITFQTPTTERANIVFGAPGTGGQLEGFIQYAHESVSTTGDRRCMIFRQGGAERMRLKGGNLLVGSTTQDTTDDVIAAYSTGQTGIRVWADGITDGSEGVMTVKGSTTGGTDRHCQIGVYKNSNITNCAAALRLQSDDGTSRWISIDNSAIVRIGTSSEVGTTSGTVVGSQTSDIRRKTLIGDGSVSYGLTELKQLNPIKFKYWKDTDHTHIGFSAQQVKPIIPEAVYETGETVEGEDNIMAMHYVNLIPVLVNSIKELSAEVDTLKTKVAALESA